MTLGWQILTFGRLPKSVDGDGGSTVTTALSRSFAQPVGPVSGPGKRSATYGNMTTASSSPQTATLTLRHPWLDMPHADLVKGIDKRCLSDSHCNGRMYSIRG